MGNNREVWLANTNTTLQRTQYYPSGLPWAESVGEDTQPYKFNGCEFIEMHGLDVTDLGNRGVQNATNRFTSLDRFCEKFPWQSPYVHAGNNPVKYVDVMGDSIWINIASENSIGRYYYGKDADDNYGFIGSDGKMYSGNDFFANSLSAALSQLMSGGDVGKGLVTDLMNSEKNLDIVPNTKNSADFDNAKYIYWNPSNNKNGGLNKLGNNERPTFIGLAHEMAHIRDSWEGTIDKEIWMTAAEIGAGKDVYNAEKYATDIENKIRAENGITLREYYSSTAFPQFRLIDNKGQSIFYNHFYYNTIKISTAKLRYIWNH